MKIDVDKVVCGRVSSLVVMVVIGAGCSMYEVTPYWNVRVKCWKARKYVGTIFTHV
jgi:hypothetical protein